MPRVYKGASEANIPIDDILEEYAAWSDEIVKAVGDELLKETRRRAKDTFGNHKGNLRKSIKKKRSRFDKDTHIVGAFAPHAHLVEFGTALRVNKKGKTSGHMPALPFLGPARDAVAGRLEEIVRKAVDEPTITVKK